MKPALKPITLILAAVAAVSCGSPDGDANLSERLLHAAAQGTPMYGHQDDLMYGHSWNASLDRDTLLERSDVKDVCGAYPAILGLDLGGIEKGDRSNLDRNDFAIMRLAAVKHHERGGIVALSWHLRNPLTGGDAWDISSDQVVASILPGGEKHQEFREWMCLAADFIDSIRDSEGKRFELIWRPWHEHGGSWFWWGAGLCSPAQYNALWRMNYDYFVKERGLDNLVWAISPNYSPALSETLRTRYPGDDVVDIVGLDLYATPHEGGLEESAAVYVSQMHDGLEVICAFARAHGKPVAVTETGFESIPDPHWWTGALSEGIKGYPVSYVLTWRNSSEPERPAHYYGPWQGEKSAEDFNAWITNSNIIMTHEQ